MQLFHLFSFPPHSNKSDSRYCQSCLKSKRGFYSADLKTYQTHSGYYSPSLLKKVVHIFRNPLDNVVAVSGVEEIRQKKKMLCSRFSAFPPREKAICFKERQ